MERSRQRLYNVLWNVKAAGYGMARVKLSGFRGSVRKGAIGEIQEILSYPKVQP